MAQGRYCSKAQPRGPLSLRIDWIDMSSAAHELPACMYAGADKNDDESLRGWMEFSAGQWGAGSVFAIKQDVRLLNDNIVRATLREPLQALIEKRKLRAEEIDWFLPHVSSSFFVQPLLQSLADIGLPIPRERWFSNLVRKGNTGSASPYIMLDELFRSDASSRATSC